MPLETVSCKSAAELIDRLSLRSGAFEDDPGDRRWVFRGHGNAEWLLRPNLVRRFLATGARLSPPATLAGKIGRRLNWWEASMLLRFVERADRAGLEIPIPTAPAHIAFETENTGFGTTADYRQLLRECVAGRSPYPLGEVEGFLGDAWPPRAFLPLLALAQHHALPTRLLDFSLNPLVAAYFAAWDARSVLAGRGHDQGHQPATELCVWAVNTRAAAPALSGENDSPLPAFEVVRVPSAGNRNLQAQEGVFLLTWPRRAGSSCYDAFRPLDRKIGRYSDPTTPRPTRLTLPVTQAGALLRLVSLQGIDGATIFPGYDGVRRTVEERAFWTLR